MSSDSVSSELSRPDPPSAWEISQERHDEMEFLDATSDDHDLPPFDVEHSLPSIEEIKTDRAILRWKQRGVKTIAGDGTHYPKRCYLIIAACVLALVCLIGMSIRVSKNNESETASVPVLDHRAQRRTDLLNLLYKTYKAADLNTSVLTKTGTPQFQAIQWLADEDMRRVAIGPAIVQRYVLAVMYYALGGAQWSFQQTGWLKGKTHECDWNFGLSADQLPPSTTANNWHVGVQCKGGGRKVDHIFLPNNNLKGELPQEMGLLTSMVHFSAFKNALSGALPTSLGMWKSLQYLNLQNNQLTGQLKDWFSFPKLEYLTLAGNGFSGDLPNSFYQLTSLHEAALNNNKFTGGVDVLNQCTNLKILYLQNNQLDGTITEDTFSLLSRLQDLDMSENVLQGGVPTSFYRITNVDLHMNQLAGTLAVVPSDGSHSLSYLSLYKNKLKGSIPTSIGFLTGLTHLDLSQNQLTGDIPDDLQELTHLEYLFLQKNPFTAGRMPSLYGLSKLKELSLQETKRNSTLPAYFGEELTSLVHLDLHDNALSGSIPEEYGNLSNMRFLFLNRNLITGSVPWELMYMKKLSIFMIDQNELGGSDAAVCGDNKPPTLTNFVADCNELQCDCCTKCCTSDEPTCNTLELQVHDDNNFSRDHYVFGENLIFSRNG
ncbi:hypothetical protein MPSEU_000174600 [Mayamaea pseudoterrestris]|nr:hypothetical protein MPSEU_000174600 [Mayamaea pseudoterrestris]